jgi:hypothetical protein
MDDAYKAYNQAAVESGHSKGHFIVDMSKPVISLTAYAASSAAACCRWMMLTRRTTRQRLRAGVPRVISWWI